MKYKIKGLSNKEIKMISYLQLHKKSFFSKKDIGRFFNDYNEMIVYLHRLAKKGRVVKLSRNRYLLVPIQAYSGWSEHPFVIVDELFVQKNYYIGNVSVLHYFGLIEQIPKKVFVYSSTRQGTKKILDFEIVFKRINRKYLFGIEKIRIEDHKVNIGSKEKVVLDCLIEGWGLERIKPFIKKLNQKKLTKYAMKINKITIVRKLGYLFDCLNISSDTLLKESNKHKTYSGTKISKLIKKWKLYL